ncbi:hypothetical protein DFH27DRAFT_527714 [Peziza echinospora]|nr:hypothetical protein DFH27DRAFT_527714 [Peziza echinospora]
MAVGWVSRAGRVGGQARVVPLDRTPGVPKPSRRRQILCEVTRQLGMARMGRDSLAKLLAMLIPAHDSHDYEKEVATYAVFPTLQGQASTYVLTSICQTSLSTPSLLSQTDKLKWDLLPNWATAYLGSPLSLPDSHARLSRLARTRPRFLVQTPISSRFHPSALNFFLFNPFSQGISATFIIGLDEGLLQGHSIKLFIRNTRTLKYHCRNGDAYDGARLLQSPLDLSIHNQTLLNLPGLEFSIPALGLKFLMVPKVASKEVTSLAVTKWWIIVTRFFIAMDEQMYQSRHKHENTHGIHSLKDQGHPLYFPCLCMARSSNGAEHTRFMIMALRMSSVVFELRKNH